MKLDQETFSFEAQFANLGPIEGIYFCVALREKYRWNKRQTQSSVTLLGYMHKEDIWIWSSSHLKNLQAHVSDREVDLGAFAISCWVEADAVHFQFTGDL